MHLFKIFKLTYYINLTSIDLHHKVLTYNILNTIKWWCGSRTFPKFSIHIKKYLSYIKYIINNHVYATV